MKRFSFVGVQVSIIANVTDDDTEVAEPLNVQPFVVPATEWDSWHQDKWPDVLQQLKSHVNKQNEGLPNRAVRRSAKKVPTNGHIPQAVMEGGI